MTELPDLPAASELPTYVQIADVMREAIRSGQLPAGERVPGENKLMERYSVARGTARQALEALAQEGLITKIPKVGTFVREKRELQRKPRRYRRRRRLGPYATEVLASGRNPDIESESSRTSATPEVAERLRVELGSPVMKTVYRFLADGHPVQSSVSFEPLDITEGTEVEFPEEGPYTNTGVVTRMDSIGVEITDVTEEVSIRPPTTHEVESLKIPAGVHVFCIRRTFETPDRPVETADIVIPGDRYALVYKFRVTDEEDPATA
jgi:GntR family transcriptional regulator